MLLVTASKQKLGTGRKINVDVDSRSRPVFMNQNSAISRFLLAFIAGFLAVIIFHQGMLALLYAINFAPRAPFSTTPTQPFGIPQIWSSAFWGGVWGLVFAAIAPRLGRNARYWIARWFLVRSLPR